MYELREYVTDEVGYLVIDKSVSKDILLRRLLTAYPELVPHEDTFVFTRDLAYFSDTEDTEETRSYYSIVERRFPIIK